MTKVKTKKFYIMSILHLQNFTHQCFKLIYVNKYKISISVFKTNTTRIKLL